MGVTREIMLLCSLYVGLDGSSEMLRVTVRAVGLYQVALLCSDMPSAKPLPASRNLIVLLLRGP